mmetsp:Transcript_13670/g.20542  ORF Transcript_13670/g.20542 Transcript_13670/m.20542 type:complete len:255 (-) Transcript_13670:700-1464(-)
MSKEFASLRSSSFTSGTLSNGSPTENDCWSVLLSSSSCKDPSFSSCSCTPASSPFSPSETSNQYPPTCRFSRLLYVSGLVMDFPNFFMEEPRPDIATCTLAPNLCAPFWAPAPKFWAPSAILDLASSKKSCCGMPSSSLAMQQSAKHPRAGLEILGLGIMLTRILCETFSYPPLIPFTTLCLALTRFDSPPSWLANALEYFFTASGFSSIIASFPTVLIRYFFGNKGNRITSRIWLNSRSRLSGSYFIQDMAAS